MFTFFGLLLLGVVLITIFNLYIGKNLPIIFRIMYSVFIGLGCFLIFCFIKADNELLRNNLAAIIGLWIFFLCVISAIYIIVRDRQKR